MSVLSTMIVLWTKLAFLRNVSTHAKGSNVETELYVRLITIRHIVYVHLASREILLLVVLMWSADMMRTVELTKSVMLVSRNALKSVRENPVAHLMLFVRLKTTRNAAIALHPYLEMAMSIVA